MNAILLALLVGADPFVMGGGDPDPFVMTGLVTETSEFNASDTRPVIFVYAPSWCTTCPEKVTRLERGRPEFDFKVLTDARKFPSWVQDVLGRYPVLHWRLKDGREFHIADYKDPEDFRRRYESRAPVPLSPLDPTRAANSGPPAGVHPAGGFQAPTPMIEVRRILAILRPQPTETFVDYGCGDGRWLIEAAQTYGCRAIGIEIDPDQAEKARRAIADAGLINRVSVVVGDVTQVSVEADVGVAYLYPDLLDKIKLKLTKLKRFATYMHSVGGLQMAQNGDAWVWTKPVVTIYATPRAGVAWYGGQAYTGRVCNNSRCSMCAAIARQLGQ